MNDGRLGRMPGAERRTLRVAGGSLLVIVACIGAVALLGDSGRHGGRAELFMGLSLPKHGGAGKVDWSAFDQQLSHDWSAKKKAAKDGHSSSELAHIREQELAERHLLAQKRLEMRKVQEEERMEALERKIELEASSQIAKHNAQLSAGLFKDADQLRPRVVFEGHFQPGTDASSKSEAAAELAAWGPRSQLYWSKVKAEQRDEARRVHRPSDDAELSGSVNGADWGADGLVPGSGGARLAKSRQQ